MIDIENKLYTLVRNEMSTDVNMESMYSKHSKLPLCTLVVMDNSVYEPFINSAQIENAVSVMVEVNAYSNKVRGKKEECKNIIKTVDDVLSTLGLTRSFCQPTPNLEDSTVCRITARYRAIIDTNLKIYRR